MKHVVRFFGLVLVAGAFLTSPVYAAEAQPGLYFEQRSVTGAYQTNVSVPVRIDASGNPLDTIQMNVTFPADKLTFVGLNESGSSFGVFLPAAPAASDGRLSVSAASLSKQAITNNVLVAKLIFKVKASSGMATVLLTGSQAYRDGTRLDSLITGTTTVHMTPAPAQGAASSNLVISRVHVTDVTVDNATVRWHTDAPSDSLVDFGQTKYYGLTAGSDVPVTDHLVRLGTVLAGNTTVHYRITSATADGQLQSTIDRTFVTGGYTVAIRVVDASENILPGASVRIGKTTAKADSNGVAIIKNVGAGTQRVIVNSGKAQSIMVRHAVGIQAAAVQQFTIHPKSRIPAWWYVLAGALVLLVIIFAAVRRPQTAADKPKGAVAKRNDLA